MQRCLIILICGVMVGCAHFSGNSRTVEPLLPDTASLSCCWQVHEQLAIDFQGEQFTLSSVTAVNDNKLTVVILDQLGRRLFAIIQQGSDVIVEKSVQIQQDLPVKWLLIGIFLRNMPDSGWSFENSNWVVERAVDHVRLMQNDRLKVRLAELVARDDITGSKPQQDLTAQLQYPDLKLEVNITTLLRQSL